MMPERRPAQSLGDYITIAISPALIMAMVGSLVFFLLEVFYQGEYEGRLQWILFWFVFATVLIARVSMMGGIAERAPLYGLALAAAVYFALTRLVEYQGALAASAWLINLGLMALIWWSAHRLTWDCTDVDDTTDVSGKGVLEASSLENKEERGSSVEDGASNDGGKKKRKSRKTKRRDLSSIVHPSSNSGWWARYNEYCEKKRTQPHTPGVWVVYFSLAALPLFGLGQSLIPAEKIDSRRYAFWLMSIYVASGLGLLLTTCYLGLRRYLRQRKLQMPVAMTGLWLMMGGGMIVVLLALGAFLPRPHAEYPIVSLSKLTGSKDQEASRYAVLSRGHGKGEGSASSDPAGKDAPASEGSGTKPDPQAQASTQGRSGQGSSGKPSGSGDQDSQQGGGQSSQAGDQAGSGKDKSTSNKANTDQQKSENSRKSSSNNKGQASRPNTPSSLPGLPTWLAQALKWIVFAVAVVVVLFIALRALMKFFANFSDWAAKLLASLDAFWKSLFGWLNKKAATEPRGLEPRPLEKRHRPFSSFHNPFWTGDGAGQTPEELVRYSFEALEALAWERSAGRHPQETPLEFAGRLGDDLPALEEDVRRLAGLYARTAYARGRLPANSLDVLRQFWKNAEAVSGPLSVVSSR